METIDYPKSSNTLSIAGLALSVLAFVIALIPCFGMIAFLPALLGLIFAIIGLAHADNYRTPKSIAVVGIVMGATALLIAGVWTGIISSISEHADSKIEKRVERIIDDIKKELKDTDIHIKIEENSLSDEELARIKEEAEKAGEVAEKIVTEILEGIQSIEIVSKDRKITIRIPRDKLNDEEIENLERELKELELEMQELIEGFTIKLELPSNEERK